MLYLESPYFVAYTRLDYLSFIVEIQGQLRQLRKLFGYRWGDCAIA
ncbi:hypothetical protein GNE08_10130 [Trichormus variabilis ARAD]|uniref:Transposase n=1 Tax=Trichormus variabilis N2B TaxID=2681315 RepID=A0ABR6S3X1_ANAVA|nr:MULTISPECIES: hypothetical protein [Nostocaceae]MBC1214580.1 hypothetical protein [Trichormus variabilis ARAD]MBC1256746.1 hypothetical protein [Trichormus variabilis V5]MBC1266319.1 hypothetical protein [Trichormus variabilis FSR]MBC1301065.1 hypothetical protein [Trichormus variabilis N2B]MBC1310780.1 hypothetical protein [Trichormus variabilis PNB]